MTFGAMQVCYVSHSPEIVHIDLSDVVRPSFALMIGDVNNQGNIWDGHTDVGNRVLDRGDGSQSFPILFGGDLFEAYISFHLRKKKRSDDLTVFLQIFA